MVTNKAMPLRGFTLVEVSLALSIAAFVLVAVLGAVPVGLRAVREAQSQEIAANIARRLQADLQPISFAPVTDPSTGGTSLATLAAQVRYYTEQGFEAADPSNSGSNAPSNVSPAFYKAVFAVGDPVFNDDPSAATPSAAFQSDHARNVTVSLYYPQTGTVAGKRKFVYSFLIARQGTN